MVFKKICLLTLLTYFSSQVSAICEHYNATCSEFAPCCYEGWCNTGQNCLAINCDAANSYPGSCYPKPLCVSFTDTFDKNDLIEISKFNGDPNIGYEWMSQFLPNNAAIEDGQLVLSMPLATEKNQYGHPAGFGATVASVRWIQYGTVTARVKTASISPGVVTSFIIHNPEGDEIDFEWVGGKPDEVQTNYYYNGEFTTKNQASFSVGGDSASEFHEYMFQWEEEFIKFYVNKKVVRTVYKKDTWDDKAKVYKYPARMALVHLGIWDGGVGVPGTTKWAGGLTNWSNPKTVYKAYFDYVDIQCKYNGNQTVPWVTPTLPKPSTYTSSSTSTTSSTSSSTKSTAATSSASSTTASSSASSSSTSTSSTSTSSSASNSVSSNTDSSSSEGPQPEPSHQGDSKTDSTKSDHTNSASKVFGSALMGAVFLFTSYIMN
ncbi:concanavalin A-like lectin/glucanase [Basidiobolus meristosporus CBS 931.73]|uniref:Concanavalin A-like lectin/glucanase n=1 Tax=Basidiobolus meristosporus CBS 931.73 TaxID=1314790 RepID=A0A1Y1XYV3_9FUNG|nr:concanavalin A-like lectin/glucanase [Basidiobolus meristosporus CBS 931.73]|eukprot:ORX90943.1 concanavalin A-like lectin/glucanase [Basidiobolus meristosporus CBS 931.73]